jgi:hypothetical protein
VATQPVSYDNQWHDRRDSPSEPGGGIPMTFLSLLLALAWLGFTGHAGL